jgi:hypothetical protein
MNDYITEMLTNHNNVISLLQELGYTAVEDNYYDVTTNAPLDVLRIFISPEVDVYTTEAGLLGYNIMFDD